MELHFNKSHDDAVQIQTIPYSDNGNMQHSTRRTGRGEGTKEVCSLSEVIGGGEDVGLVAIRLETLDEEVDGGHVGAI
jgi:hypothetical protein